MIFLLKQSFRKSLVPDMTDKLLEALSLKKLGKEEHAVKIKEVYHREIAKHKPCGNCSKGMIPQDIKPWLGSLG